MKLWIASDYTRGRKITVDEINPTAHGQCEKGEILHYFEDGDDLNPVAAYYWDDQRKKYRKYTMPAI